MSREMMQFLKDRAMSARIFQHDEDAGQYAAIAAHITQLQAEVDALRKDADRYQYLRKQHWTTANLCVVVNPASAVKLGYECLSLEILDTKVDTELLLDINIRS
jgi:hypothetical protein